MEDLELATRAAHQNAMMVTTLLGINVGILGVIWWTGVGASGSGVPFFFSLGFWCLCVGEMRFWGRKLKALLFRGEGAET